MVSWYSAPRNCEVSFQNSGQDVNASRSASLTRTRIAGSHSRTRNFRRAGMLSGYGDGLPFDQHPDFADTLSFVRTADGVDPSIPFRDLEARGSMGALATHSSPGCYGSRETGFRTTMTPLAGERMVGRSVNALSSGESSIGYALNAGARTIAAPAYRSSTSDSFVSN